MTGAQILISAFGLAFTAAAFFAGRMSSAGKRGVEEGEQKAEIRHIKEQVDKLVKRSEERERIDRMAQDALRIAMLGHNRLNEHLRSEHGVRSGFSDYSLHEGS